MNLRLLKIMLLLLMGGMAQGQDLSAEQIRTKALTEDSPLRDLIEEKIQEKGQIDIKLFTGSQYVEGILIKQLLIPLVEQKGNLIIFNLNYYGDVDEDGYLSSPNGDEEIQEALRQLAIKSLYPSDYWAYLMAQGTENWEVIATELSMDINLIRQSASSLKTKNLLRDNIIATTAQVEDQTESVLIVDGEKVDLYNALSAGINNCYNPFYSFTRCMEPDNGWGWAAWVTATTTCVSCGYALTPPLSPLALVPCAGCVVALGGGSTAAVNCWNHAMEATDNVINDPADNHALADGGFECSASENQVCVNSLLTVHRFRQVWDPTLWPLAPAVVTSGDCFDCPNAQTQIAKHNNSSVLFTLPKPDRSIWWPFVYSAWTPEWGFWTNLYLNDEYINTEYSFVNWDEFPYDGLGHHSLRNLQSKHNSEVKVKIEGHNASIDCESNIIKFTTKCPSWEITYTAIGEVYFNIDFHEDEERVLSPYYSVAEIELIGLSGPSNSPISSATINAIDSKSIYLGGAELVGAEISIQFATYHLNDQIDYDTNGIEGPECQSAYSHTFTACDLNSSMAGFYMSITDVNSSLGLNSGAVALYQWGINPPISFIVYDENDEIVEEVVNSTNTEFNIDNLQEGNYRIELIYFLQTANGQEETCEKTLNFSVGAFCSTDVGCLTPFNLQEQITHATSTSQNNGGISFSNTGLTYFWDDIAGGTTDPIRTNLSPGEYCVEAYAANCCYDQACFEVGPTCDISVTYSIDPACFNQNNGIIDLEVNGGSPPYQYYWNNGSNASSLFGIAAGDYFVHIYDSNNCHAKSSFEVPTVDDYPVQIQANHTTNSLYFTNVGLGSLFNWTGPGITEDNYSSHSLINMPPGEYCLIVESEAGCIREDCIILYPPLELDLENSPICDIDYFQSCLTVSGGSGNYNIQWDSGSSSNCTPASYGVEYCVTVTDLPNPEVVTQCYEFETTNILDIEQYVTISYVPACPNQSNGRICVESSGGMDWTYAWYVNSSLASSWECFTYAQPGNEFTLVATDACGLQGQATYVFPDSYTYPKGRESERILPCENSSNGSLTFVPSEGIPPYSSFRWVGGTLDEDVITTEPTLDNLGKGQHWVYITDACGEYEYPFSFYMFEAPNENPLELTWDVKRDCQSSIGDGAIDLSVTGDDQNNLSYEWYNQWMDLPPTQDISGLLSGAYEVTVTQNSGCQTFASIEVENGTPTFHNIDGASHPCPGQSNGSINGYIQNSSFGTAFYSWSHDSSIPSNFGAVNGLSAGDYTVTVTTIDECEITNTWTLVDRPAVGEITGVVTDKVQVYDSNAAEHFGLTNQLGAIDLSVSESSTQNYTYNWSNGATTQDLSDLEPAFYSVTVTNESGGCTATKVFNVIDQNTECGLEVGVTATDPCGNIIGTNSRLIATPNNDNGSPVKYYYTWRKGNSIIHKGEGYEKVKTEGATGTYSVIVTDENGCYGFLEDIWYDRTNDGEYWVIEPDSDNMTFDDETFSVYQSCSGTEYCGDFPGSHFTFNGGPDDGDLKFYPLSTSNPCFGGGIILCTANNSIMATVPPMDNAQDVSTSSKCACLFPQGSVLELYDLPVYAQYICPGDDDIDENDDNNSGYDDCVETEEEISDDGCNVEVFCIKEDGERIPFFTYDGDNVEPCRLETSSGCHVIRSFCACEYESIEDGAASPDTPTTWDELIYNCEDDTDLPTCDELFEACWGFDGGEDPQFRNNENAPLDQPVFAVYPNPYVNSVTIKGENPGSDFIGEVSIYNSIGETVLKKVTKFENGGTITHFNGLGNLPEGIYYLIIRDRSNILKTERIIKINP